MLKFFWCPFMAINISVQLDAGSRAGFTSSRPPPPWTDLGISFFLFSVQCVALRNLDLLIKTGWSVILPVFC